jgi:hypothetical protein
MVNSSGWKNVKYDKGQLEMLNKWNRLGFNFEPNYQLKFEGNLFYLDGYDKKHNVVFEYDSKYHKHKKVKERDLVRQQLIIEKLKPKAFWRYDAVKKSFNNVVGKEK